MILCKGKPFVVNCLSARLVPSMKDFCQSKHWPWCYACLAYEKNNAQGKPEISIRSGKYILLFKERMKKG